MKILITGANGFLGGYLSKKLLDKGHEVHGLTQEKEAKVAGVIAHKGDLLQFRKIGKILKEVNPDIIMHLAARTEVEKSFYDPIDFSTINYVGTVNLIEKAKDLPNLKLFYFASTMETYGEVYTKEQVADHSRPDYQGVAFEPFNEDTPQKPNAPYAVAKLGCEYYLEYAKRAYNFPFCAVRQTNTYGRYDNDFFVTEQIITQMLKQMKKKDPTKRKIKLGYKDPYRNFLFVYDLIDLYETIIDNPEKVKGEIFTCGPDNALTMEEYAKKIAAKIGYDGVIEWDKKPVRVGEIYYLNSTNIKIQNRLGWSPKTDLDTGLDLTIKIWKENYGFKDIKPQDSSLHEVQSTSGDSAAEPSSTQ
jgi:nucleoside-diphosphate-sugar epimerase